MLKWCLMAGCVICPSTNHYKFFIIDEEKKTTTITNLINFNNLLGSNSFDFLSLLSYSFSYLFKRYYKFDNLLYRKDFIYFYLMPGMKFDLNSGSDDELSSNFAIAMPKLVRRRGGLIYPSSGMLRRYSDSGLFSIYFDFLLTFYFNFDWILSSTSF